MGVVYPCNSSIGKARIEERCPEWTQWRPCLSEEGWRWLRKMPSLAYFTVTGRAFKQALELRSLEPASLSFLSVCVNSEIVFIVHFVYWIFVGE